MLDALALPPATGGPHGDEIGLAVLGLDEGSSDHPSGVL